MKSRSSRLPSIAQPKVAIVHDYLNQYGGAERVVEALHEIYPQAPIYTSVYDQPGMSALGFIEKGKTIRTSFMQHLPFRHRLPRYYFTLFYPFAFLGFNLSGYNLIISSASYAAKYVRKPKGAVHICYCHTPPRFLYGYDTDISVKNMNMIEQRLASIWRKYLLYLDQRRSRDIDVWIANSQTIKDKIHQAYGKEAVVVYPPVDIERFNRLTTAPQNPTDSNYFFVVSRLGEYKRVDIIVKAFNQLGWPLKVVGRGPQAAYLKQIAKPNVQIYDALPDEQVSQMYQQCRAFVIAANEDFGITPVEAMACGKPVIALGKGGYLETIIKGKTGVFFDQQTEQSLISALLKFDTMKFDQQTIKNRAKDFSLEAFKKRMREVVEEALPEK